MTQFLSEQEVKEFKSVLDGYQMNEQARSEFMTSNFVIIIGPSGVGKDTLRNSLIKQNPSKYVPILSTTTRPPRPGERDGEDYHFWPNDRVLKSLQKGEFFQASLVYNQQVSALDISEIRKLKSNQTGISILIIEVALQLIIVKPDIKLLFLVPPSLAELERRLWQHPNIQQEEVSRRLRGASRELELAAHQPKMYCVINNDMLVTRRRAQKFLESGERDLAEDKKARQTIGTIISQLKKI